MPKRHYVFIVGGVMSGVGKGTCAAALGALLKSHGLSVTAVKIDPYINVDAGTMNPVEHGECFVTNDGDETDQDIGNYERFIDADILSINYMTTGRVYQSVIERERNLGYGGKTVQVVPDVPDEVIARIERAADAANADVILIEIGGTVGEYENILFLEAARMMRMKHGDAVRNVLVSFLPLPSSIGEMKTKPTQQAVRLMMTAGLMPDFIVARAEKPIDAPRLKKLANFGNVYEDHVIAAPNVKSIYDVPLRFAEQNFGGKLMKALGIEPTAPDLKLWIELSRRATLMTDVVKIAVLGKYFSTGDFTLSDAYISVIEAIKHAGMALEKKVELTWLNAEEYENDAAKLEELRGFQGVVVPGGFGSRGVEGKIMAIRFCRENKIPYLGLCYGMQCAVIEFARNVVGLTDANTEEINPFTPHPVIHLLPGQDLANKKYGGTMRLGAYKCALADGTMARAAYDAPEITERHRHRYEFNNTYRDQIESAGLVISGVNPEQNLVEIIEVKDHPFFVGVQFHPEFLSRPMKAHPLFRKFVEVATLRV